MGQREKFADERHGAESYNEECGVIARWLHDGLLFRDEADERLRTDMAEVRAFLGEFLALPVADQGHGDLRARARAWLDRGA